MADNWHAPSSSHVQITRPCERDHVHHWAANGRYRWCDSAATEQKPQSASFTAFNAWQARFMGQTSMFDAYMAGWHDRGRHDRNG